MNQHIFVETKTALRDGVDVLVMPITDAFQNGCFVMEKMIVGMDRMKWMKIVGLAKKRAISDVETGDVFPSKF